MCATNVASQIRRTLTSSRNSDCNERSTVDVLDVGGAEPSNPAFPQAAARTTCPRVCSLHVRALKHFRLAQWSEVVDVLREMSVQSSYNPPTGRTCTKPEEKVYQ